MAINPLLYLPNLNNEKDGLLLIEFCAMLTELPLIYYSFQFRLKIKCANALRKAFLKIDLGR